jgi:hypothetical protein
LWMMMHSCGLLLWIFLPANRTSQGPWTSCLTADEPSACSDEPLKRGKWQICYHAHPSPLGWPVRARFHWWSLDRWIRWHSPTFSDDHYLESTNMDQFLERQHLWYLIITLLDQFSTDSNLGRKVKLVERVEDMNL